MAKTFEQQENEMVAADLRLKDDYIKRGFLRNHEEAATLHMSFSPFRVPKGLTKLQIRRRINRYNRHGNPKTTQFLFNNSLEILVNGKRMVHASFYGPAPKNLRAVKLLIKGI